MSENRPFVLTLAGFDPSGGAGILADIKTFEQHKVYGLAVNTADTLQTDQVFSEIRWADQKFVLQSLRTLFRTYKIRAVKIGIVPSLDYLLAVLEMIRKESDEVKVLWDPVIKSSTDFPFMSSYNFNAMESVLHKINLITPNYEEMAILNKEGESLKQKIATLSKKCSVLLKGGHHPKEKGTDFLYFNQQETIIKPGIYTNLEKHGSGCVLAASIVSNLALGDELVVACEKAKKYVENFLISNTTLLGHHYV